jgi:hypothetical protein
VRFGHIFLLDDRVGCTLDPLNKSHVYAKEVGFKDHQAA